MVGAGQQGIGARCTAGLRHHVGRRRGGSRDGDGTERRGAGRKPGVCGIRVRRVPTATDGDQLPFGVDFIKSGSEALGQPA